MSEHIFRICIDRIVHNDMFLKVHFFIMFWHVLWDNLSALLLRVCWAQVFFCVAHTDVFTSNYFDTLDLYQWKLNFMWSCKWIICKRISEHTSSSVGSLLTHHIKFCRCNNSMPTHNLNNLKFHLGYVDDIPAAFK